MMRAAQLFGPADLRIVDLPIPHPAKGQVLVAVKAYAPYGTDVGTYLNRHGRYVAEYPVGIGADFSGIVAGLGEGVEGLKIGDRVAALALDHCGICENCTKGRNNLCLDPAFKKLVRQVCAQEYTLVSACKLAVMPDEVSFEDAAMLAGIVDALNAFELMGLKAGDAIAILGVGAMGQGAIAAAIAKDLHVTALGGTGKRVEMAAGLGAKTVPITSHGESLREKALALTPHGFDAILETTASEWGIAEAFAIAAPGAVVALTGGGQVPLTAWDVVDRELRIVGVRAGHHQAEAMQYIASGKLSLQSTISGRFTLEEAAEAFAALAGEGAKDIGRFIIQVAE